MPISFTDRFGIDKVEFNKTGAFDVILDTDSRIFIDPALLDKCVVPEFIDARKKAEKYFSAIITLLSHTTNYKDMYWKKADKMLTFKEISGTCCGYSQNGTSGNAIGPILRKVVLSNIKELIEKGEKDPTLFELLGAFQEGIGCDRISDLLTFILSSEIFSYTERILSQFGIATDKVKLKDKVYNIKTNEYNEKPLLLLPTTILSPLPVADNYDDIDFVCFENERVRQKANEYLDLGNRKKISKPEIFELMLNDDDFRKELLSTYKTKSLTPYDFVLDPAGEYSWYNATKSYAEKFPLSLTLPKAPTPHDVLHIAELICTHYQKLIQNNGLWSLLYDDNKKPKHERAAQLLFFGIADAYCTANNIDLSREINNGRGAVDFKLSRGAIEKVVVEIKLTSNSQLEHGFTKQVPIYMEQENTNKAIYLIIDNGHPARLENFIKLYNNQNIETKSKVPYVLIDGVPPKSASTA